MAKTYALCVIGGGASGLMAALAAVKLQGFPDVVLLEGQARVGKKLLATGNGRCNFSHREACDLSRYHSGCPETVEAVLSRSKPENTLRFFEALGIPAREEDGRLYPYSLQAGAVVDVLRYEAARLGVEIRTETPVKTIQTRNGLYIAGDVSAKRLIVATGGMASPALGSDGSGYALLEAFGHRRTPLFPALTQLVTTRPEIKGLSGVRIEVEATLLVCGKEARREREELMFTDYGLSGPLALALSREASSALAEGIMDVRAVIDLFPDMDGATLRGYLQERIKSRPERPLEDLFLGLLHKRLGLALLRIAELPPAAAHGSLKPREIDALVHLAKAYPITITGTRGFTDAQVTCGGIDLSGFVPETLESRFSPGLYACGEVLDVDGDCGGFNLQWAWSSGAVAGMGAAQ